jgi:hypothetical protein
VEYFTDDITCMPARMIWRTVWRTAPLLSVPLFLMFLLQRSLGWRPPANYGLARPVSLPEIQPEQVPPAVCESMRPHLEALANLGFQQMFYLNPLYIGGKQSYSVVLLHSGGLIFATVVWFFISRGSQTRSNVVSSCHSLDSHGKQMTTGPLASEHWNPELIPPFHDLLPLPLGTSPADVLAIHQERVSAMKDLVRLNRDSLAAHMLNLINRLIDFMVEKGYYVPLSPAEIASLTKN